MRIQSWRAAAVFLSLAIWAPSGVQTAVAATLYTQGHSDIAVAYEDDEFWLHYHFGGDAVDPSLAHQEVDPTDVIVIVKDEPLVRPAGTQWNFMGTPAGEPIWILPQIQAPDQPWPGFATEELAPSDWVGGITFTLKSVVASPAGSNLSLWQSGSFGTPSVRWDTVDGIGSDDKFTLPIGNHSHFNWGFTKQGVYQIEVEARGTHITDGPLVTSDVFTFNVVPEPTSLSLAGIALVGLGCVAVRRRFGKQ